MFFDRYSVCINLCIPANWSTVKVFKTTRQAPKFAARNFPENHTLSGSFWWIMPLKKHQKALFISLAPASVHLWQDSTYVTAVADVQPGRPVAEGLQIKLQASECWHAPTKSEQTNKKKEELHYDSVNVLRACFLHWGSDKLRWIQTQQRDQVLLVLCSCVCVRSIIIGLFANRAAFRAMMGHFHIKENSQNAADAARNNETTPCAAC